MKWLSRIRHLKIVLIGVAVLIAVSSLAISHFLIRDLAREERNRMEIWAEAMRSLNTADETTDMSLVLKVINGNNTIPVIVLDRQGNVVTYRNLSPVSPDSIVWLTKKAQWMRQSGYSLRIDLDKNSSFSEYATEKNDKGDYLEICYEESILLKRLAGYPYVQLGIVLVFVLIAIFALLSYKKAEQNRVWVGLSKETAHQLGTPISSLMAWVEILKENYPRDPLVPELDKDVARLQLIAERFSKIGSVPEPRKEDLTQLVGHALAYISRRSSNKIVTTCHFAQQPLYVDVNAALFEWVIENLCKNAVDAMAGEGRLTLSVFRNISGIVVLEIADTGKGIARNCFKKVFSPGFTTKKRGWGLGLSLAKRIVEEYHQGRIFVKSSEIGKGTVFRIELKK